MRSWASHVNIQLGQVLSLRSRSSDLHLVKAPLLAMKSGQPSHVHYQLADKEYQLAMELARLAHKYERLAMNAEQDHR